jgi:hypothetical protein
MPSSIERCDVTARSFSHHAVALRLQFDVAIGTTLQTTNSSDARKEEQR